MVFVTCLLLHSAIEPLDPPITWAVSRASSQHATLWPQITEMLANVSQFVGGERALLDSHARKLLAVCRLENSGWASYSKYL
jgi:sugar (pentulose or hexulose) kinase